MKYYSALGTKIFITVQNFRIQHPMPAVNNKNIYHGTKLPDPTSNAGR
jgi:hypothetical protein